MPGKHLLSVILMCFAFTPSAWGSYTLSSREHAILKGWLALHPGFREANDFDCDCMEDIQRERSVSEGVWKRIPNYHPYAVSADLNGDGIIDFAVVVIDTSKQSSPFCFVLLVFDGPFGPRAAPVFEQADLALKRRGLSFGPPRPKPYRLVVGPFESDNTVLLIPTKKGYRLDASD